MEVSYKVLMGIFGDCAWVHSDCVKRSSVAPRTTWVCKASRQIGDNSIKKERETARNEEERMTRDAKTASVNILDEVKKFTTERDV